MEQEKGTSSLTQAYFKPLFTNSVWCNILSAKASLMISPKLTGKEAVSLSRGQTVKSQYKGVNRMKEDYKEKLIFCESY